MARTGNFLVWGFIHQDENRKSGNSEEKASRERSFLLSETQRAGIRPRTTRNKANPIPHLWKFPDSPREGVPPPATCPEARGGRPSNLKKCTPPPGPPQTEKGHTLSVSCHVPPWALRVSNIQYFILDTCHSQFAFSFWHSKFIPCLGLPVTFLLLEQ